MEDLQKAEEEVLRIISSLEDQAAENRRLEDEVAELANKVDAKRKEVEEKEDLIGKREEKASERKSLLRKTEHKKRARERFLAAASSDLVTFKVGGRSFTTTREMLKSGVGVRSEVNSELNFSPNFEGLVLGCIDADFCK